MVSACCSVTGVNLITTTSLCSHTSLCYSTVTENIVKTCWYFILLILCPSRLRNCLNFLIYYMDYLNFHKHCDRVFRRFLEFYFILHKDASVASDLMGEKLFRSALVLSVSL